MNTPGGHNSDPYTDERPTPENSEFVSEPAAGSPASKSTAKGSAGVRIAMFLMAAFLVIAVIWYGMKMMSAHPAPVAPPASTAPASTAPASTAPASTAPASTTPAAIAPVAAASTALPGSPSVNQPNPLNGLSPSTSPQTSAAPAPQLPGSPPMNPGQANPGQALPMTPGMPAQNPPSSPASSASSPSASAPSIQLPTTSAPSPAPSAQAQPAAGHPDTQPPFGQEDLPPGGLPAAPSDSMSAPSLPASPVSSAPEGPGIAQARHDIMAGLDRLQGTVSAMDHRVNTRMDSFDRRLTALETHTSSPRVSGPADASAAARPRPPSSHRSMARHEHRVRHHDHARDASPPEATPTNRIEFVQSDSSQPVEVSSSGSQRTSSSLPRHASVDQPAISMRQDLALTPPAPAVTCHVSAIQPGRFWVRHADGTFSTYGVDDQAPTGGRVTKVDPETGIFVNGTRWDCSK